MAIEATGAAVKKHRSPNYPSISLETALEKAAEIYEKQMGHQAAPETVMKYWGYGPKTSNGLLLIASLKRFDLLDDEGSGTARRVKISDLAKKIITDRKEGSVERAQSLKEAALAPQIYKDIWDHFAGDLPPADEAILHFLEYEKNFSPNAARDCLRHFRATIAFANLGKSSILSPEGEDMSAANGGEMENIERNTTERALGFVQGAFPQILEIPIPLGGNKSAKIRVTYPLSEDAWERMLAILKAYKPSLVEDKDGEKEN